MTLDQFRDQLLDSLRVQFKAEVRTIALLKNGAAQMTPEHAQVEAFLKNVANNMAAGFADKFDEVFP